MKKYLILLVVFITVSSCRVTQIGKEKESFVSRHDVEQLIEASQKTIKTELQTIENTVSKLETAISKTESASTTEASNETTNVSGSIIAEDGKEKSATIGNTTITSNGANISFSTTTTKDVTKAFQSIIHEQRQELQQQSKTIISLQSELTSLKKEFATFISNYESDKATRAKTVKKTGFQAGVWIIVAIVVIVLIVLWYFRKSIPFLN